MNLAKSWAITRKDFAVFRRKRTILLSLVAFPLAVSIGLPAVIAFAARKAPGAYASLVPLTDALAFFFVLLAVILSTSLASYAIVGEKVERSLEPLLATPTTDSEILVGKTLAAFLPTIAATFLGAGIFMAILDALSHPQLGYWLYPNWGMGSLFLVVPLAGLVSVEVNVLISSIATDVRTAQQFGTLVVLPFAALYVLGETKLITLDSSALLILAGVLVLFVVALFPLSRATFRRETILTQWK